MGMVLTYNLLLTLGVILAFPWMAIAVISSKKRRKTVLQRLGLSVAPGFRNLKTSALGLKPLWVHALSVGEVLSAISLARALKENHPGRAVVFSASTLTGFETASRLLRDDLDVVFYFPYDLIFSVRSVINRICPALVVIVETDIWPNFLFEMKRRLIPVVLVNARLSDRSYSGYRRFSRWTSPVFRCFSFICAQSREDARRFVDLGIPTGKAMVAGNLKYDSAPDLDDEQGLCYLRSLLSVSSSQQCLVAGSTHPGEEAIVLEAFSRLKATIPALCLILAPRDIDRSNDILRLSSSLGLKTELLTQITHAPEADPPSVVVVNTIGHLKALYALSNVAFVGGSLINFGGHNPLEPAALAKPILLGPYTGDVADSADRLLASGGARVVRNADELVQAAQILLTHPEIARTMGQNALEILQENQGALEKTLNAIGRYIRDDSP